nr:RNA-binding domain-containing protein [Rhodococcus sp. 06-621-2]
MLNEGRWVELKKDIPAKGAGANRELAKDLASLSVDGGTLIVGIEEASAGVAGSLVGADLGSLQIRINQVSQSTIHPALHVSTQTFDHPTDPGLGVMIVSVPASASAPHMVDGAYWGRTEHGKATLSDDEVRRLMAQRRSAQTGFSQRVAGVGDNLRAPAARDRATGQLVLRFEPIAPAYAVSVSDAMAGLGFPSQAIQRLVKGTHGIHGPRMMDADQDRSHPDGWFATSLRKRDVEAYEAAGKVVPELGRVSILVDDSGAWSIVSGCATRPTDNSPEPSELCIYTRHILELTHVVCGAIASFSTAIAPYYGQWQVGVSIDNLDGVKSSESYHRDFYRLDDTEPYSRSSYEVVVMTSTQELDEHPSVVVERLFKNFLRGMGLDRVYFPYTDLSEKISR